MSHANYNYCTLNTLFTPPSFLSAAAICLFFLLAACNNAPTAQAKDNAKENQSTSQSQSQDNVLTPTALGQECQQHAATNQPWNNIQTALVIDIYHGNEIDWEALAKDPRITAIIHKATEGVTYTDPRYHARKQKALKRGYLWGSYHLGRADDPIEQAKHYLKTINPSDNELMALDLESLSSRFMTIDTTRKFLTHIKSVTGRYPLLYTNEYTAKQITTQVGNDPVFANSPLWYANYTDTIAQFPTGTWSHYTLWQFASEANCPPIKKSSCPPNQHAKRKQETSCKNTVPDHCPYRIPGITRPIDTNIFWGTKKDLKQKWPFTR